jgi:tetratricopeptide (TPR) repeat protein
MAVLFNYFIKSYIGLSDSYQQLGELIKAEKILLQAHTLMPNNGLVVTELGVYYYSNGDYNRAIDYFKLLVQQAPNNFTAYLNISACHYLNGDIDKAILAAEQALTIKENYIVYSNIGTYHFILEDYGKAVVAFEKMINLNDSDYANWGNLADAYRFDKDDKYHDTYTQAMVLAKQALELNPQNRTVIASLAYYYANLGNIERNKFYANKITVNDTGENAFLIAAAYAHLKMNKAALKYIGFAIINNYSIAEIATSPLFDNLKKDSQYRELITKALE